MWAAWLLVGAAGCSILLASLVGPVFLFVDHVILGGLGGLIMHDFSSIKLEPGQEWVAESPEMTYMIGVFISFLMFFPVAMGFGALGAFLGKDRYRGNG